MYKLVVLFALVAVAVAAPKPGLLAAPALAYSSVVGSVPTSISSQSSSVVHSAALAAPVVHAAPAVAAYAAPAIATYAAPAVAAYAAAPAISYATHSAPAISYAAHSAPLISAYSGLGLHGGLIL